MRIASRSRDASADEAALRRFLSTSSTTGRQTARMGFADSLAQAFDDMFSEPEITNGVVEGLGIPATATMITCLVHYNHWPVVAAHCPCSSSATIQPRRSCSGIRCPTRQFRR